MNNLKQQFTEQTIMFFSVAKWIFLSIIIGIIIGYAVGFFIEILDMSDSFKQYREFDYFYLLPLALIISIFLVRTFAPTAQGHGTERVIEAIHRDNGKINILVVPIKLFATIITLFAGGSAGKEGPGAQIGAGCASAFASLFKFNKDDRKKLVICGISAGFATVFGTPIAGAIFGVEVLFIGAIMYDVLLPSMVSGLTAYMVSKSMGIIHGSFNVFFYQQENIDQLLFAEVIFSGIFFGFISVLLIQTLQLGKIINEKIKLNIYIKAFCAGLIIVGLTLIFGERYLGLGTNVINEALNPYGYDIKWYDSILKMVFTSLTLSFGGSGGILTPIFYIGATSGHLYAEIFHSYAPLFAAIGFVSVLSGTANAPIAASVMAVELFGIEVAQYAAISCVISYLITGHRSVFPSQILVMKKSSALDIKTGDDIEHTIVKYDTNRQKRIYKLMRERIKRRRSKKDK